MLINFDWKKVFFIITKKSNKKISSIIEIFLPNPSINHVQFINNHKNQQPSPLGKTMSKHSQLSPPNYKMQPIIWHPKKSHLKKQPYKHKVHEIHDNLSP
jgi:hypothetical protein